MPINMTNPHKLHFVIAKGQEAVDRNGDRLSTTQVVADLLKQDRYHKYINCQIGEREDTPLHIAYARKDMDMVKLLKQLGASENLSNNQGFLPHQMLNLSYKEVESVLASHTTNDYRAYEFKQDKFEFMQNRLKAIDFKDPSDNQQLDELIFCDEFRTYVLENTKNELVHLKEKAQNNPKLNELVKEMTIFSAYVNEWANTPRQTKKSTQVWLEDFNLLIQNTERTLDHLSESKGFMSKIFANFKQMMDSFLNSKNHKKTVQDFKNELANLKNKIQGLNVGDDELKSIHSGQFHLK